MSENSSFLKELAEVAPAPRIPGPVEDLTGFNVEYGFLEAHLRGMRSGFLSKAEYKHLTTVETIEDFKTVLQDTDYVTALQGLAAPRAQLIYQKCFDKFVSEFEWIRSQALGRLAPFIDLIAHEFLIANVVAIIAATVKGTPAEEVLEHCHPLGRSPYLKSMLTFEKDDNILDLYRVVLVDLPVAKYFAQYFDQEVKSGEPSKALQGAFKEVDVNIISDQLRKLWLEDLYAYCKELGGETWTVMKDVLEFEADRRAIEIVHNSIAVKSSLNDPLHRASRQELFCSFGKLYPDCTGSNSGGHPGATVGARHFSKVDSDAALAYAVEPYPQYREAMRKAAEKTSSLSDALKQIEVDILKKALDGQSHFASFYAFVKLKLVELENLRSIGSALSVKTRAGAERRQIKYVPIF